jgi:hypothetical protein
MSLVVETETMIKTKRKRKRRPRTKTKETVSFVRNSCEFSAKHFPRKIHNAFDHEKRCLAKFSRVSSFFWPFAFLFSVGKNEAHFGATLQSH